MSLAFHRHKIPALNAILEVLMKTWQIAVVLLVFTGMVLAEQAALSDETRRMMAKIRLVQIVCPQCHFALTIPVPKGSASMSCPKCGSEIEIE